MIPLVPHIVIAWASLALFGAPSAPEGPGTNDAERMKLMDQEPRPRPEDVIAGFIQHLKSSDLFQPEARDFVLRSYDQKPLDEEMQFLNDSLAILSDGFRMGLDLMAQENAAAAAEVFGALCLDEDPYLAVAAANQAAAALLEFDEPERCASLLGETQAAHQSLERYTLHADQFLFMLGYGQVHNLEYEKAAATLSNFLKRYPDAPERFRVTATQILTELDRRIPGRLGDVRDLLSFAHRRLNHGDAGERVVKRQQEAADLLSAMIEEAEESEKAGSGKPGGGGSQSGGQPGGNQNPTQGASQSTLPGGESRMGELRRRTAKPGDAWGKMPPREREQILQTLQRRFPSQYRELLEQYYKQLAKDSDSK